VFFSDVRRMDFSDVPVLNGSLESKRADHSERDDDPSAMFRMFNDGLARMMETVKKTDLSNTGWVVCPGCNGLCMKSLRCSRCRRTVYCSVECQRRDWEKHRATCLARCHVCDSPMDRVLRCSRCKGRYYCSVQCQEKDWGSHKDSCTS